MLYFQCGRRGAGGNGAAAVAVYVEEGSGNRLRVSLKARAIRHCVSDLYRRSALPPERRHGVNTSEMLRMGQFKVTFVRRRSVTLPRDQRHQR